MRRTAHIGWLVLAGCSFAAPLEPAVTNYCELDDECSAGTCDKDMQMCFAATPEAPYELAIEVLPATDDWPAFISEPQPLMATGVRDVRLPLSVDVPGTVRFRGERVPAEIVFTRPGLPGRPVATVRASTFEAPRQIDDEEVDFLVRLPFGFEYQMEVRPSTSLHPTLGVPWSAVVPPWRRTAPLDLTQAPMVEPNVRLFTASEHIDFPGDLDVACGQQDSGELRTTSCRIEGTIVTDLAGTHLPQAALRVQAVEIETGRLVSSTVDTTETGTFALALSAETGSWELVVKGSDANPLFPEIRVNPNLLLGDQVVIQVPVPDHIEYQAAIEDEDGNPVAGAAVLFVSEESLLVAESAVRGSFRIATTSDSEGNVVVSLVPGQYEVVITPADDDLAVTLENLIIEPATVASAEVVRGQVFAVQERPKLSGTVLANAGTPMENVRVDARALYEAGLDDVSGAARYNRSSETLTLPSGQFRLPLDVGSYDVFIQPPPASRFAWRVIPGYAVGRVDIDTISSGTFELGSPLPLRGVVSDFGAHAVGGAEVRAYARILGADRFVEVGRTQSAADGSYELLLPARLN